MLPPNGLLLAGCLAICIVIELLSMWNLTRIEVHLCNMLSPEAPQLSLASYDWCLVFIAMLVDNFLYPLSAMRSHLSQSVNWSGIQYHLKDGKICKRQLLDMLKSFREHEKTLSGQKFENLIP